MSLLNYILYLIISLLNYCFFQTLWSYIILLGLNFFISKIKDFERINSWDTVYLQSTKLSELELNLSSTPYCHFQILKICSVVYHPNTWWEDNTRPQINSSKTPFVTFCWVDTNALIPSPLLIYILCKCFQFGGDICLSMFTKFLRQINFIFCIFTFCKKCFLLQTDELIQIYFLHYFQDFKKKEMVDQFNSI